MARIIELILTQEPAGKGTTDDMARFVTVLYTKDGKLVAQHDPCGDGFIRKDFFDPTVIRFAKE